MQITIIYGSTGGSTEEVAQRIAEQLSCETTLVDVANASKEDFENSSNIILGTSTWGDGDLQDDWEDFFEELDDIDFTGKKVAFYGLGDQDSYYDTFLNGMGTLYAKVKEKGAIIVGDGVSTDSYDFGESTAEVNGTFVGLGIDEDNQSELSEERIASWTKDLEDKFN